VLLDVDVRTKLASRRPGSKLGQFGLDERGFQEILFNSLDRLLPEERLLLILQSRRWREDPDLLALDSSGRLYIFELKLWESREENLLQALRYGQLFGQYDYDQLADLYAAARPRAPELRVAHEAHFGIELPLDEFNCDQVFVVMTNGLDVRTREAIRYWTERGLKVEPWIYRVYAGDDKKSIIVELRPFEAEDDPYEDIASGYYIFNTNYGNDPADDADMLANHKAAAFYEPWKYKVERLQRGDTVFLYRNGTGIVAYGHATRMQRLPHYDNPDEQYAMPLSAWRVVDPPMTAADIKRLTSARYSFRGTMFSVDTKAGKALERALHKRSQAGS
jgi:hypothetical protein